MTIQHKDLTIQYKVLTRRHKDLTSQHNNYLTNDGSNIAFSVTYLIQSDNSNDLAFAESRISLENFHLRDPLKYFYLKLLRC